MASKNINIEEYIHATNHAADTDALFQIFINKLQKYGLDRVVYSYMTDSQQLKKKAEHGVVRNYPEDWMKHYIDKKYIAYDPVYRTAFISRKPFSWKELIASNEFKPKEKKVMNEAKDAGLKEGIALSIKGPMGEVIGVGLASSHDDINTSRDALSEIYLIVNQFHICYSDHTAKDEKSQKTEALSLTAREREILIWCAKNKSMNDIGTILGISKKTVEFHLGNIFRKLGVNGKILAVLKAFHLGLIGI